MLANAKPDRNFAVKLAIKQALLDSHIHFDDASFGAFIDAFKKHARLARAKAHALEVGSLLETTVRHSLHEVNPEVLVKLGSSGFGKLLDNFHRRVQAIAR